MPVTTNDTNNSTLTLIVALTMTLTVTVTQYDIPFLSCRHILIDTISTRLTLAMMTVIVMNALRDELTYLNVRT